MTLKPITLKDGTQIPAGAYIETANTPVLYDPSLYPEPEVSPIHTSRPRCFRS